jgi:hypothetical protein
LLPTEVTEPIFRDVEHLDGPQLVERATGPFTDAASSP